MIGDVRVGDHLVGRQEFVHVRLDRRHGLPCGNGDDRKARDPRRRRHCMSLVVGILAALRKVVIGDPGRRAAAVDLHRIHLKSTRVMLRRTRLARTLLNIAVRPVVNHA